MTFKGTQARRGEGALLGSAALAVSVLAGHVAGQPVDTDCIKWVKVRSAVCPARQCDELRVQSFNCFEIAVWCARVL
eukprot:SAG31_NODE_11819_length_995_cov_1.184152_1_plen_76_part_10